MSLIPSKHWEKRVKCSVNSLYTLKIFIYTADIKIIYIFVKCCGLEYRQQRTYLSLVMKEHETLWIYGAFLF
jgi:hypothetical protein